MTVQQDTFTGAEVRRLRELHGLSRGKLSELTGLGVARIANIEVKDSWKPGDADRLRAALDSLGDPPPEGTRPTRRSTRTATKSSVATAPTVITANFNGGLVIDPTFWLAEIEELAESVSDGLPTATFPSVTEITPPEPRQQVALPPAVYRLPELPEGARRVSNGEVQTWQRCRRKWWFGWYRRLTLAHEGLLDVRATGTRIHRALAAYYVPEGQVPVDPRDALERVLTEDWTRIREAAVQRYGESVEGALESISDSFTKAAALERAMISGYVEWIAQTGVDADIRVVGSEQPVAVMTEVPTAQTAHHPVQVVGLMDERVVRTTDGARLFVDHKTVGDLRSPTVTLPLDQQMLHYHLLEWLSSREGEERCDGALYNMLRRVKRTERAKPPFYDRVEVRHNPYELEAYRRRLLGATRDMIHAEQALNSGADPLMVVYPTPRKECSFDCDFVAVCAMVDDGSRLEDALAGSYKTTDPYARYDRMKEEGGTE